MNRLKIIASFLTLVSINFVQAQDKPLNVVWVNADDLGREVACYGEPAVRTPNIDALAKQGILYTNAYANAPVCSSSRTSQITAMYPTAVNGENHRTMERKELPNGIKPITDYFKEAGYFISNGNGLTLLKTGGKKDYNFEPSIAYDGTHWRQRKEGQPFFAQVQIKYPHRPFVSDTKHPVNPDDVRLPKCYLDHPLLRADWAKYLESVQHCDEILGKVLAQLEEDGLAENTVVFFFGDHGRPHVRDKQFLYEGGLQIPLIVRWPNKLKANKKDKRLVSLVDVAATTLEICGLKTPYKLDGKVFLGSEKEKRAYIFGFRQRTGDAVENMRSITDGRYKLIWNRTYDRPWMQVSSYKKLQYPAFSLYHYLHAKGELKAPYNQFMAETKSEFELFDLKKDPSEFNNLYGTKKCKKVQKELVAELKKQLAIAEKGNIPETEAAKQKGILGSLEYFNGSISKMHKGIRSNASYEELVKAWERKLLK
ncbi:sulfatase family protein [Wenyingzhuangia sp. IMCC45574]